MQEAMRQYLAAQDIHERVSSSHESYAVLAQAFARSDALYRCQRVLSVLGEQALKFAQALRDRSTAQHAGTTARAIEDMQTALRYLDATQPAAPGPLRALHALGDNLTALARVFASAMGAGGPAPELSLFDRQPQTLHDAWDRLRAEWNLRSALMRHALRLAFALLVAFGVMHATHDPHGYWIVLTVVFTSQPHFAATLSRMVQRAVGTVVGLAVGWALIRLFPAALLQAACMVLAGALFIGKRQTDLRTATAAITTLVLLSFHQMGMAQGVIPARLLDAALGSAISALAAWLVLPNWQARYLPHLAAQALRAQAGYLHAILLQYQSGKQDHLAYRLARRNAHNADAALANAYGAMRKEPRSTRLNEAACGQFVVLSHMLLNFLSALGAHRGEADAGAPDALSRQAAGQLQQGLERLSQRLDQPPRRVGDAQTMGDLDILAEPAGSPDVQSLLLSQLRLASRLLPALSQQAALLKAPR
jgi:YccS/YhfK family integral membrane protein